MFTFNYESMGKPMTGYAQCISVGKIYPVSSLPGVDFFSSSKVIAIDEDGNKIGGTLNYTTSVRGGEVIFLGLKVEGYSQFVKGDDKIILAKNKLTDETIYLFTSVEAFESYFDQSIPVEHL